MTTHTTPENLPFVVCPRCEGYGHHGPGHVFTQDELDDYFGYDQDKVMADYRDGRYDVTCGTCEGQRVVRAECDCTDCRTDRFFLREMEAMEAAERRFGC